MKMTKCMRVLFIIALEYSVINGEIGPKSEQITKTETNLLQQLSHKSKGTFVVYGHGRQKERDLPVCESDFEACNLAHLRYWITPITERLCRCPKVQCQLNYTSIYDQESQHVSNRGQFKFCGPINQISQCESKQVGLEVQEIDRSHPQLENRTYHDVRSNVLCTCPWPNSWTLNHTYLEAPGHIITRYSCSTLAKCDTGDICGYTRTDTLETYYTCSCPEHHLCLFTWDQAPITTQQLFYYGPTYEGRCTRTTPESDYNY